MKKTKRMTAVMAGLLMMMATAATANALTLGVSTDGSTWQNVVDNGSGDTDLTTGSISYTDTTLSGFTKVKVSGATDTLQTGGLYMNTFETSSSAAMLYLKLSDFPFTVDMMGGAIATTGLTMQNLDVTANLKTYYGAATLDTAHLIAEINLVAPGFVGHITNLPSLEGPFSLTEFLTIDNKAGVASQITASLQLEPAAPVPEPGTMALLGIGMLGMAMYGKRRIGRKE